MTFIDFLVYILGVYGISWLLVFSQPVEPLRLLVQDTPFLDNLLKCIVCTSVWVSAFFVFWYFPAELWYSKCLIVGTTTTTTWLLALFTGDSS